MSHRIAIPVLLSLFVLVCLAAPVSAGPRGEIDRDASAALQQLYRSMPVAAQLGRAAKGVLVFPKIVKGGFIFGGQYGEGALRKGGKTTAYYSSAAASYGLQAGVQSFGYVMMFMSDKALEYLNKSAGWEIGVGPSVVVVDQGLARSLSTTTARDDIYVFFFNQKGLMAGLGLQGSKITRIYPKN